MLYQIVESKAIYQLAQVTTAPVEFTTWLSVRRDLFFDHFHPHWPIIHRPTFDEQKEPLIISATMVTIGVWLEKSITTQPLVYEIHKTLVGQLFEQLVRARDIIETKSKTRSV